MAEPVEQDFRGKYTRSNWLTRRLLDDFFRAVADLIERLEVRSALEVGCGEGFSTQRLRRMLPATVAFEASDVEDRLVRAAAAANPNMPIRRESIYTLARPDQSVDLVLALEVLEHLEEPSRALGEVCRVSRRWVLASVPREPLWRLLNLARLKYLTRLGNTPGHLHHWSTAAFRRFMAQRGRVLGVRRPLPWTVVLMEVQRNS